MATIKLLPPDIRFNYADSDGEPLAFGKVWTSVSGGSTPAATFSDAAGVGTNTNPVILDGSGEADIYLTPGSAYRFVVMNAANVVQRTTDGIYGATSYIIDDDGTLAANSAGVLATQRAVRQYVDQFSDQLDSTEILREVFTATQGQTVFTLVNPYVLGLHLLEVDVNGANQLIGVDFTETSTTSVTMTTGLNDGDIAVFTIWNVTIGAVTTAGLVSYGDGSNVEDALDDALNFTQTGTGAVERTVELKLRDTVSVKDFGAIGNSNGTPGNGADDFTAIQAALDYVEGSGGGTVLMPKSVGHYRITQGLKIGSYITLEGPAVDRYPYNGGAMATTLFEDFASANQWMIEPKTTVGGSPVPYNVSVDTFPSGPTYNCAVKNLQLRSNKDTGFPYGGIRMHGCPGSVIDNVSVVGTGCGALINECYGGYYSLHTISRYYGVVVWQEVNACTIKAYSTISDAAVKTVPVGYLLPFMTALSAVLTGGTYNLSTNAHYNRCWGSIVGANTGSTSSGNTLDTTVEGFGGAFLELNAYGTNWVKRYMEGSAGNVDFGVVAAQSKSFSGNFHAFNSGTGALFDIGSFASIDAHVNGLLTYASFGTVYLGPSTQLVLRQCDTVQFGVSMLTQYNVLLPDDSGVWVTPTFTNSWDSVGSTVVQYRKNGRTGNIELKGRIGGGGLATAAFTLPAGFRPGEIKLFPAASNGAATYGGVLVSTAGVVTPAAGNTGDICLDGMFFQQLA